MRTMLTKQMIALVVAGALCAGHAAAETLRAGGTGSAAGMLRQLGARFAASEGAEIKVVPGLGSGGALNALKDGAIDIAASARPLNDKETAAGLRQVAALRTAFVLATSHLYPNRLKRADLPTDFTSSSARWADGASIRIILRPRSETDNALLATMSAGMSEAIEQARGRPEVPVTPTDQDNVAMAENVPGSLTGTTMAQLKTEQPNLRLVPLDTSEPTLANVQSGAYPYVKHFYVVLRADGPPAAQRFADFLRSPQGIAALRDCEVLPESE